MDNTLKGVFTNLLQKNLGDTTSVLFTIVLIITSVLLIKKWSILFAPGPWGIPVLGYFPFLPKQRPQIQLSKLAKKHGDTYLVTLCGKLYLHINTYKALREAFVTKTDCFAGRSTDESTLMNMFKHGVAEINGEPWRLWRKFIVQGMRELGLGTKGKLNDSILNTVQIALNDLKSKNGQVVNATSLFCEYCTEVTRRLFIGSNVKKSTIQQMNADFAVFSAPMLRYEVFLYGWIPRYIITPWIQGVKEMKMARKKLAAAMEAIIKDHTTNFDSENPQDFIDLYLREKMQRNSKNDPRVKYFTDKSFISTLIEIYGDGGFTIGTFIAYYLKRFADLPEVQDEIYKEIVDVIGTERLPAIEDRDNLPYTHAAIKEMDRTMPFLAMVPSLECSRSTNVCNTYCPKGAIALVNMYGINNDPNTFKDPEKFDAKRFLPGNNDLTKESSPLIFGIGKRSCAGEPLVTTEVFLFISAILQRFKLQPAEAKQKGDDAEENLFLDDYKIIPISRT